MRYIECFQYRNQSQKSIPLYFETMVATYNEVKVISLFISLFKVYFTRTEMDIFSHAPGTRKCEIPFPFLVALGDKWSKSKPKIVVLLEKFLIPGMEAEGRMKMTYILTGMYTFLYISSRISSLK